LFLALLQPPLLLIDHGHFQYNSVSLGLILAAINFALQDRFIISAYVLHKGKQKIEYLLFF